MLYAAVMALIDTHPDKSAFLAALEKRVEPQIVADLYRTGDAKVSDSMEYERDRLMAIVRSACS